MEFDLAFPLCAGFGETWKFLERRIEEAVEFKKSADEVSRKACSICLHSLVTSAGLSLRSIANKGFSAFCLLFGSAFDREQDLLRGLEF